jgi:rubrerythrin
MASSLPGNLAKAIEKSNRIMAEDIVREAGFMLPQSDNAKELLGSLIEKNPEGFPKESAEKLLKLLYEKKEEEEMEENRTVKNLMEGFAGESQANRKYLAYAEQAEKEGRINAAKLFRAAAEAEAIHARKQFEIAGKLRSTEDNLKDAIAGETYEYKEMYPPFLKEAQEAGNKAAATIFNFAMRAEEVHARLYQEALENIDQTEEVFYYLCPVCGNIEKYVPEKCAICGVPGDRFKKF